jgi:hypothetical protein
VDIYRVYIQRYLPNVLWVAFFNLSGPLSLVYLYPVLIGIFTNNKLILYYSASAYKKFSILYFFLKISIRKHSEQNFYYYNFLRILLVHNLNLWILIKTKEIFFTWLKTLEWQV